MGDENGAGSAEELAPLAVALVEQETEQSGGDAGVSYSALRERLEDEGLEALREHGRIVVDSRVVEEWTPADYNSCLYFAIKYGLAYSWDGASFVMFPE